MIVIIIIRQHVNTIEISILKECRSECECAYHSDLASTYIFTHSSTSTHLHPLLVAIPSPSTLTRIEILATLFYILHLEIIFFQDSIFRDLIFRNTFFIVSGFCLPRFFHQKFFLSRFGQKTNRHHVTFLDRPVLNIQNRCTKLLEHKVKET